MEEISRRAEEYVASSRGDLSELIKDLQLFIEKEESIARESIAVDAMLRSYIYDNNFIVGNVSVDL